MWPYINQEDLTSPGTFLLLLHARGYHDPAMFAVTDLDAMHLGRMTKIIKPDVLDEHIMIRKDCSQALPYGTLLHRDDDPRVNEWLHNRGQLLPGEGLLVLEAQDTLLSFLVNCSKELLCDVSEYRLTHGDIVPNPMITFDQHSGIVSASSAMTEAPYRALAQLEYGCMAALIAAKRDQAADHLLSLRDDPAYFSEYMKDALQHQREMIPDSSEDGQALRQDSGNSFWGHVLSREIIAAVRELEMWSMLFEQCCSLRDMQHRYGKVSQALNEMPQVYKSTLLKFRYWLSMLCELLALRFEDAVASSPIWRPYHQTELAIAGDRSLLTVRSSKLLVSDKEKRDLLFLLRIFFTQNHTLLLWIGMTTAMDELQRFIDASSTAGTMITSHISNLISDLSIVIQCLHQTELYQPWFKCFSSTQQHEKVSIERSYKGSIRKMREQALKMSTKDECSLGDTGNPYKVDFRYPIHKRRTRETVDMMRTAETNLQKFWDAAQTTCFLQCVMSTDTKAGEILKLPPSLPRTAEWVEPDKSKTSNTLSKAERICQPLSEMYLDLQQRTENTLDAESKPSPLTKSKIKSRGSSRSAIDIDSFKLAGLKEEVDNNNQNGHQSVYEVNARALKVFKTLFFTPSTTSSPGEVAWSDFLHAMTSMGFDIKKLHGSMWQFSPMEGENHRNIIFHEPHPSAKIPYHTARRHGRRLNKVYGWNGDSFVLARSKLDKSTATK